MKYGINLYLWADEMHDGLLPVLESLKRMGYDGVEVPIFDLDESNWKRWSQRLDDLGLERTANTVIAPEHNPVSPDPAVRKAAFEHMQRVVSSCAAAGSSIAWCSSSKRASSRRAKTLRPLAHAKINRHPSS